MRPPLPKKRGECLSYFGMWTPKVKAVLVNFHTEMWNLGISNAVIHNEVTPGRPVTMQHDPTLLLHESLLRVRRLRLDPGAREQAREYRTRCE